MYEMRWRSSDVTLGGSRHRLHDDPDRALKKCKKAKAKSFGQTSDEMLHYGLKNHRPEGVFVNSSAHTLLRPYTAGGPYRKDRPHLKPIVLLIYSQTLIKKIIQNNTNIHRIIIIIIIITSRYTSSLRFGWLHGKRGTHDFLNLLPLQIRSSVRQCSLSI